MTGVKPQQPQMWGFQGHGPLFVAHNVPLLLNCGEPPATTWILWHVAGRAGATICPAMCHSHIGSTDRRQMSRYAQVVKGKSKAAKHPPKGTPTLEAVIANAARRERRHPRAAVLESQPQGGHARFGKFDDNNEELKKFRKFLSGLDGGRKQVPQVKQIAANVSKFLKYAHPKASDPVWVDLLDSSKLSQYIDELEASGTCGPSGQLGKMDHMVHGLRYLRLKVAGEENAGLAHRCNIMEERITRWKAAIRPAQKLQQQLAEPQRRTSHPPR